MFSPNIWWMISVSFFYFPLVFSSFSCYNFIRDTVGCKEFFKNCGQNSSTLDQHRCFFQIICIQSPSERILNFLLPVRRRINERTLLADISGWERRRRLVRRFAATGTTTAVAPVRGGGSDGSLSSWAALQDTIWHCTLRRSDYLESMRSWAATYYRLRSLTILSALHSLFLLLSCLRSRSGYWGSLLQAWGCRRR